MSLNAGDIVFTLKADDTALSKALTDAKTAFSGLSTGVGAAMTAAGAAITGFAATAVMDFVDTGSAVNDMSLRTGFGVEKLQELGYAAGLSGGSMDDVEKAAKKMSQTIFQAGEEATAAGAKQQEAWAKGSTEVVTATGTYTQVLQALGLSYQQLAAMSPEDQFMSIGFALADVANATDRAALAQQVFGRAGTSLLPMLSEGRAGFEAMAAEARRLGIVMDATSVAAADTMGDSIDKLKLSLRGFGFDVAEVLLPALLRLVEGAQGVMNTFSEWRNSNPELFDSLATIVIGVGAIMTVLGPLLIALPGLISAFAAVKTAVLAVGAVFAALAAAVNLPVVVIGLAIANLIAWGYAIIENWDAVKAALIEIWKVIANAFELIMSPIMYAWEKMKGFVIDSNSAQWDAAHPRTAPGNDGFQARGFGGMALAGAGGGQGITMNFNISGATDPSAVSRAIAETVRLELKARGL